MSPIAAAPKNETKNRRNPNPYERHDSSIVVDPTKTYQSYLSILKSYLSILIRLDVYFYVFQYILKRISLIMSFHRFIKCARNRSNSIFENRGAA